MTRPRFFVLVLTSLIGLLALLVSPRLAAQTPGEGIKVHGRWVIEVRGADGTLKHRREFENALTAEGQFLLASMLSRSIPVRPWRVIAWTGTAGLCGPGDCFIGEPSEPTGANNNLTVTRTSTERGLVLAGHFTAVQDKQITSVFTGLVDHEPDGNLRSLTDFTHATLATPIAVTTTQVVSITVTISFE